MRLNCDYHEIVNHEKTPEGFLKVWLKMGVADQVLHYPDRQEVINADALFNEKSINTAVGKPIVLNHPPGAINSQNYTQYLKGSLLQEYANKDGDLVMAAIVYDSEMIAGIENGDHKYVSAAYKPVRELNNDGVYMQSFREYNHVGILDKTHYPRAGDKSTIIYNQDAEIEDYNGEAGGDDQKETPLTSYEQPKEKDTGKATLPNNDSSDTPASPDNTDMKTNFDADAYRQQINQDAQEKVQILSKWKSVLDDHRKAIDYNLDSRGIKRQVLSCFYPINVISQLNSDAVLDGFWINFELNHADGKFDDKPEESNYDSLNYDDVLSKLMSDFEKSLI